MRGTGVSGLRGILPLNENSGIIRPLLFARKTELEQFARREKIRFKKDASNESDDYLRNRIRHHLVPVFMELNPGFEKIMERNMSNLAFGESIVTGKVGEMLQGFGNVVPNAGLKMSRKMLTESGFPREMLMSIVQRYGFNSAQVDDIWQAKASGKQVFSDGYVLTAEIGRAHV